MLPNMLDDIARLWLASYADTLALTTTWDDEVADWSASFDGAYGQLLAPACLVAKVNGIFVAAIQTVIDAPWPHTPTGPFLTELLVHPDWRRRGIATTLIRQALIAAHNLGHNHAGLRVDPSNTAARELYRAIGFVDWHE